MGFAAPAATARQVVMAAVAGGHAIVRPWLGARTESLSGQLAQRFGLSSPRGVLVVDLWPGGPAARAGVRLGEVILSVNGQAVGDGDDLAYRVGLRRPGEPVRLLVRRANGVERSVVVTVEAPLGDTGAGK